jgi:hypothetical protein
VGWFAIDGDCRVCHLCGGGAVGVCAGAVGALAALVSRAYLLYLLGTVVTLIGFGAGSRARRLTPRRGIRFQSNRPMPAKAPMIASYTATSPRPRATSCAPATAA